MLCSCKFIDAVRVSARINLIDWDDENCAKIEVSQRIQVHVHCRFTHDFFTESKRESHITISRKNAFHIVHLSIATQKWPIKITTVQYHINLHHTGMLKICVFFGCPQYLHTNKE